MVRVLVSCAAIALMLIVVPTRTICAAELKPGDDIILAQRFSIHSEVLREDRNVLIYLPESYDLEGNRERRYAVVYLLDREAYFHATTGIVHHLSAYNAGVERVPELIVVAIANTKRTRDMTPSHMAAGPYSENSGGTASFRAFLGSELIPQIDSRFRTTKERILVGHSLAGLFILDTFIERPELFGAYIAIDPNAAWDSNVLARKLKSPTRAQPPPAVRVFIAEANSPFLTAAEQNTHKEAIRSFRDGLKESSPTAHQDYRYFVDETHLSVPLVGIYAGLLSIYSDYKKP